MQDYLLFRLYGPVAAWGDIAVGEYRPSYAHPSKSAIVGLLAAALGIRRDEEERQKTLTSSCSFAVRVDAMGILMRDYHTTQVPPEKKGVRHDTRRSELASNKFKTILSNRDYRCDAVYTIAINLSDGSQYTAWQLADALKKPIFTLYLGRKSCPLALPLSPIVVRSETLREAFHSLAPSKELADILSKDPALVYWENNVESGLDSQQIITRHDEPRSRKRWQFSERREHCGILRKEDESCSSV